MICAYVCVWHIYGIYCVPVSAVLYICIYGMCLVYNVYVIHACVWYMACLCNMYGTHACSMHCMFVIYLFMDCVIVVFVVCVVHEFGCVSFL